MKRMEVDLMRGSISAELVASLSRIAGFDFAQGRCEQLVPQLEWLLEEAERIEELSLAEEEPVNIFRPGETVGAVATEEVDSHG
jgi:hypothetical protein